MGERNERKRQGRLRLRVARGRMRTDRSVDDILGECRAFVGERNDRKRQDRLRLRVARGRMRTDRGRLMTY